MVPPLRQIPDPNAKKPEGWLDDAPLKIPDPKAKKPADWCAVALPPRTHTDCLCGGIRNDEDDGEWEAPLVDNPVCERVGCGEWKPPMIKNPKYKGKVRQPCLFSLFMLERLLD